jgi:hypothetical protein
VVTYGLTNKEHIMSKESIYSSTIKNQKTAKAKILRALDYFNSHLKNFESKNTEKLTVIGAMGEALVNAAREEDSVIAMKNLKTALEGYRDQARGFHRQRIQTDNFTWATNLVVSLMPGFDGSRSELEKHIQQIINSFNGPIEIKEQTSFTPTGPNQ